LEENNKFCLDEGKYKTPLALGYLIARPAIENLHVINIEERKY
jgi:hypothetical protein